jgi:hypothetical protein
LDTSSRQLNYKTHRKKLLMPSWNSSAAENLFAVYEVCVSVSGWCIMFVHDGMRN